MGLIHGCCGKTVKYLLILFCFLVFVAGIAILAVSITAVVASSGKSWDDFDSLKKEFSDDAVSMKTVAVACMILGLFLMLIGSIGCCGAFCESIVALGIYAIIMFILVLAQGIMAIHVIVQKNKIKSNIKNLLKKSQSTNEDCQTYWKKLQDKFTCCGIEGNPVDYCQKKNQAKCSKEGEGKGCTDEIYNYFVSMFYTIGMVLIGFVAVETIAAILAILLCCKVKKEKKLRDYHMHH